MPHPIALDARQEYLDERKEWRESLPPSPVPHFLTGLDLRPPDPRDFNLAEDPEIRRLIDAGLPETADIVSHFKGPVLNQGAVPSCVAHTMAHMQAIYQSIEEGGVARVFDAPRAHRETGAENQGRWPDDLLRYCQQIGMPLSGAGSRYRITAYAFAPKGPQWADAIKAAIVAGRPVPICYLLPQNYGWESSGAMTQGYHETLIVGYRPGALLMLNSWGSGWGKNGYGWVPIDFLEQQNYQNGHVIAHSGVMDERLNPDPQPPTPDPPTPDPPTPDPQPQPPPGVTVEGKAEGGGLEFLRVGTVLQSQGGGFSGSVTLSRVTREQTPTPDPQPLPPDPTGELQVRPLLTRARGGWNLFVYVTDPLGTVGAATVTVTSPGGVTVRMVRQQASLDGRAPATASVRGPAGGQLVIEAKAGGRSGQAAVTLAAAGSELPPLLDEVDNGGQ